MDASHYFTSPPFQSADTPHRFLGVDLGAQRPSRPLQVILLPLRPPHVAKTYPEQRRYGADLDTAYEGVADVEGKHHATALVSRNTDGRNGPVAARLAIDFGYGESRRGGLHIDLQPAALRELANMLTDAAADIEAHPAPAAEGGAA